MEEEDATSGKQVNGWYVGNHHTINIRSAPLFRCGANRLSIVITDPEDPKFDLEAFLKLKAGEL
jgi:hypothetical protein